MRAEPQFGSFSSSNPMGKSSTQTDAGIFGVMSFSPERVYYCLNEGCASGFISMQNRGQVINELLDVFSEFPAFLSSNPIEKSFTQTDAGFFAVMSFSPGTESYTISLLATGAIGGNSAATSLAAQDKCVRMRAEPRFGSFSTSNPMGKSSTRTDAGTFGVMSFSPQSVYYCLYEGCTGGSNSMNNQGKVINELLDVFSEFPAFLSSNPIGKSFTQTDAGFFGVTSFSPTDPTEGTFYGILHFTCVKSCFLSAFGSSDLFPRNLAILFPILEKKFTAILFGPAEKFRQALPARPCRPSPRP